MIAVVDYGAGNLQSVVNALEVIGQKPMVTNSGADLEEASAIVLPGVGAFGDGMAALHSLGLVDALNEQVIARKKPFLGICVGLQFLADEGYEHGRHRGLGWIAGTVERIVPPEPKYRVPHMGWNDVRVMRPDPLFESLPKGSIFYFLHSYHFVPAEASRRFVTTTSTHGVEIVASVRKANIMAVQFHPEKSQEDGIQLLENFVALVPESVERMPQRTGC